MKVYFAFFLIIIAAFVGYHLTFRQLGPRRTGFRFTLTGLEFLLIGLLLGPLFSGVIDGRISGYLAPMTALLLGWIGLMTGFQFEWALLRRFAPAFFFAGIIESGVTALVVFGAVYIVMPAIIDLTPPVRLAVSVVMAATAACSAQAGLVLWKQTDSEKDAKIMRLLRFAASVDGLVPMFLLGFFYFFRQPAFPSSAWPNEILLFAIIAIIFILYTLWMSLRWEKTDLALVVIGMTVLTSGAAAMLAFSPLVANFFIGVFLVNFTREKEKIFNLLVSIEKPVYLALLIFMGASWHLEITWMPFAALFFLVLRMVAKTLGGLAMTRVLPELRTYPPTIGFGLIEQGGLTLAILYDFQERFAWEAADGAVGFVLLSVFMSNFISPYMLTRVFKRDEDAPAGK